MKTTTLCYIRKNDCFLMLYRNKKENDLNAGKWIGVGGKCEPGETPEQCLLREVYEETGLTLTKFQSCGKITFILDAWEDEITYLYTADEYTGEINWDCNEGILKWVPIKEVLSLNLWEGDRLFLEKMTAGESVDLWLHYDVNDVLAEAKFL